MPTKRPYKPRKPVVRSVKVTVRLSEKEHDSLSSAATEAGLCLGEWMREKLLKEKEG